MCSAAMTRGSQVQILDADLHTAHQAHAVVASHLQSRGRLTWMLPQGSSSSSKKEEDWQQMLAEGQSSSPKTKQNKTVKGLLAPKGMKGTNCLNYVLITKDTRNLILRFNCMTNFTLVKNITILVLSFHSIQTSQLSLFA